MKSGKFSKVSSYLNEVSLLQLQRFYGISWT